MLAFKEWTTVIDAMICGRQTVIIRKGGIAEDFDKFELRADEFLLFPTLFHQLDEKIKPDWLEAQPNQDYYPNPNQVRITHKAIVKHSNHVSNYNELLHLKDKHVYTDAVIQERFNRWNDKGVYVIEFDIEELDKEILIEITPEMMGCKSWINISF